MDTSRNKHSRNNLEEKSNIFTKIALGWTWPIFIKGAKRDLEISDLYDPLRSDESDYLGDCLEREWKKELRKADEEIVLEEDGTKRRAKQPSLTWALIRVFRTTFMLKGLGLLCHSLGLQVAQPIIQGWIISYFSPSQNHTTQTQVLIYSACLIAVIFSAALVSHHMALRNQQIGMRVKVACSSLIYRKVLRLNQAAVSNTAAGQVANILSNDVARFDFIFIYLHYLWLMPLQTILIGYVMWQSVGISALVGIGAMLTQTIPIQGYLSHLSAKLRSKIAVKTDERVQLMSELISGCQVVKMYSWEKPFEYIVKKIRAMEIKLISQTSYLRGFYLSIMVFCERVTLFLTLICFVLLGNPLAPEITFVMASLFNILQFTSAICFPQALIIAGEASISLNRITDFLLLDEVKTSEKFSSALPTPRNSGTQKSQPPTAKNTSPIKGVAIEMVKVAANWVHGQLPPTLCELTMEVQSGSLCALVGPVGAGKSSILQILLGELPVGAGRVTLYNTAGTIHTGNILCRKDIKISYACQDPWLFSASIRDNILLGEPYDKERYQEVTRVCALHRDFQLLPQGDLTSVGERGSSLSGGQKARVNLARAVYREADLYLLDDPLSAVDPRVSRQLFEECINGYLKGKTRILVTHQLQYLPQVDKIVVLNRGTVERQGTYKEIADTDVQVSESEESVVEDSPEDPKSADDIKDEETKVSQSITEQISPEVADNNKETVASGSMSSKVYIGYFKAGGNICSLLLVLFVFIVAQLSASGTDYWLTYWTNQEVSRTSWKLNHSTNSNTLFEMDPSDGLNQTESQSSSIWYDELGLFYEHSAMYIYTLCMIMCILLVSLRSLIFVRICMNASRNIHNAMFANLLKATMRFFNTNPTGRILNRFSKDVGAMDETLPKVMLETLQIFSVMIGILTMVVIVNYWMAIPIVIMGTIFYTVRIYYMKTAQHIKRLEGVAKSPVFSHVSSTLDGLTTIRSRGAAVEELLRKEFDHLQDTHSGAWYLTLATATAFGCTLDFVSCCFIACVCYSFILIDAENTLGGNVGLALSQSLILTGMVQHGIRQSTEVIAQMTSVERVLQYTALPKEGPFTTKNPPPATWPEKGRLTFKNVSMKYADHKPPVLKDMNLQIEPGWKIGIVGRTGAGKSSLISALFCLTGDGLKGKIEIDGIDTKSIGLHELRPKISIIPQEPILFSASIRYNLDPFEQYTDDQLWDTLREVELGDAIPSLDFRVAGGGANFSVGQRQLVCLARAILRNNRLLVLDEATANVDRRTDALIQNTIRRRFADCTVLTIAHRLNTIMDSDKVLVMAAGQVLEFGNPHQLLRNPKGHFSEMLQQTGKDSAEKLAEIARVAYEQKYGIRNNSEETRATSPASNETTYL
ncbi:ATP-binding cassette sub-family C member 4-like [Athalia rosae]|uniref:ATP-binding cassette sub-family C member 4-like n=1 Tax=Athalia rosae TaxID=37344 RepID=UPI002034427C|nr:ATP-binding cassette sub-family C member 4-like [Athalia rosae]